MVQDFTASVTVKITWETLHRDTLELVRRLKQGGRYRGIIAVARGGMVPAAIVARELDMRLVDTVCIVSYDDRVQQDGEPTVLKPVEGDGEGWLVIDDLVDSGATFRHLRKMLPKAHYATVYAKPRGRDAADTTVVSVEQDLWLVFPWDDEPEAGRE